MVPGITFSVIISFVMREFIDPDETEKKSVLAKFIEQSDGMACTKR